MQSTHGQSIHAREHEPINIGIIVTILVYLPLLAAAVLAMYPLVLRGLRAMPPHEYAQAVRAPAWFVVIIGGGMFSLALLGLRHLESGGDQVFFGFRHTGPLLFVDAYTLWGSALLGAVLAVSAWVPAARRSLAPRTVYPFAFILVLVWLALLMLTSVQFSLSLLSWLMLLAGVAGLWFALFRPDWRWQHLDVAVVLALAAIFGIGGLWWLSTLARESVLLNAWSVLLSASPRATNGATLLVALAWLGPAVYLPWWLWTHREEQAMVWLPSALVLAVAGQLAFTRMICFAFPAASPDFAQIAGTNPLFLVQRVLGWLLSWGLVAVLVGAGWLTYTVIRRQPVAMPVLRPLTLVVSGLLLISMAAGIQAERGSGIVGILWMQLTWAGVITIWLTASDLLSALAPQEQGERNTLLFAIWLALAMLVCLPPGPGFRALQALWTPLRQMGAPQALIAVVLAITAICTAVLLPRWSASQSARTPRAGVGWGIIGPFALALSLLAVGLLANAVLPVLHFVQQSLLQAY